MSKPQGTDGPGLRLGAGGQVLSSGCTDLDHLCGGGLALGSLVIILEVFSHSHNVDLVSVSINPKSALCSPAAVPGITVDEVAMDEIICTSCMYVRNAVDPKLIDA